jgi:hypothetical protein
VVVYVTALKYRPDCKSGIARIITVYATAHPVISAT